MKYRWGKSALSNSLFLKFLFAVSEDDKTSVSLGEHLTSFGEDGKVLREPIPCFLLILSVKKEGQAVEKETTEYFSEEKAFAAFEVITKINNCNKFLCGGIDEQ